MKEPYASKLERIVPATRLPALPPSQQAFLREQALRLRLTQQELRQLADMALDLHLWGEDGLESLWPADAPPAKDKKRIMAVLKERWEALRALPARYEGSVPRSAHRLQVVAEERPELGLGWCPVASGRTRCCNLLTLDAVQSCGFDCSYCSIQSFYNGDRVGFDSGFAARLQRLEIDPERIYHIGTGQSSDSLMWGNLHGTLAALLDFARRHPNVILELKTKSHNVAWLLKQEVPANVLCTWSLNTPPVIDHEEHLTAPLERRLEAARSLADRGVLVGFHFHPMIHYRGWREDYAALFHRLVERFRPQEVAMVSLGTLTFTRKVVNRIRDRGRPTQVLRMPFHDAEGKLSYPPEVKIELFSHAYRSLAPWHRKVFFYLCMESPALWRPVFGFEYPSNTAFETAMKCSYMEKVERRRREYRRAHAARDESGL